MYERQIDFFWISYLSTYVSLHTSNSYDRWSIRVSSLERPDLLLPVILVDDTKMVNMCIKSSMRK